MPFLMACNKVTPKRKKGNKMQFAKDILNQLGGNQFLAMTGTKNIVADSKERSVFMTLTRNNSKANRLKITVDAMDTYTVEFIKFRDSRINMKTGELVPMKWNVVKSFTGIYYDQLRGLFERVTGSNTSLTHIYA